MSQKENLSFFAVALGEKGEPTYADGRIQPVAVDTAGEYFGLDTARFTVMAICEAQNVTRQNTANYDHYNLLREVCSYTMRRRVSTNQHRNAASPTIKQEAAI